MASYSSSTIPVSPTATRISEQGFFANPAQSMLLTNVGSSTVFCGTDPSVSSSSFIADIAPGNSVTLSQPALYLICASGQTSLVAQGTTPTLKDVSPVASLVEVFGNSISVATDYNATSRIANALGAAEVNHSITGMVHCWDDAGTNPGGYATTRQRQIRFDKAASYKGSAYGAESDLVLVCSPENDLWALAATNRRAVMKHGIRSMISHALVSRAFEETHANIAYSGTWSTQSNPGPPQAKHGTGADSSGAGYKFSSTQGDSFAVTIPGDYPGSARSPLALAFVGFPTAANATATLTASGAATGTFDLSTANVCDYTNSRRNGVVWRFTGNAIAASNGTPQTLTVTLTTITNAQRVALDYVGFETDLTTGQPRVIVQGAYKMNPFNAAFSTVTDTDVANCNTDLQAVVNEFGSSVSYLDVDSTLGGLGSAASASTTLNGAHIASGNLTVASTAGFPTSGTVFVGDGSFEQIRYTSTDATHFLGCTRGAWSSTAASHAGGQPVQLLREAAVPNFLNDGIHWSEDAHRRMANAILDTLAPGHSLDTAGRRGSGGRNAASNCKVFVSYNQVFGSTNELNVPFDRIRYQNGAWFDPRGIQIAQPLDQHQFQCPTDGNYGVTFNFAWDCTNVAGTRLIQLYKTPIDGTGNQKLAADACNLTTFTTFDALARTLHWEGDVRRGDILFLTGVAPDAGTAAQGTTVTDNPLTNAATTINLAATTNMANGQTIRIENELVTIGTVASGTQLTGCTRGVTGTLAVQHASGAFAGGGVKMVAPSNSLRFACELTITRFGPLIGTV